MIAFDWRKKVFFILHVNCFSKFGCNSCYNCVISLLSNHFSLPFIQKVLNCDSLIISGSASDSSLSCDKSVYLEISTCLQCFLIASQDCLVYLFGVGIEILLKQKQKILKTC